MAKQLLWTEPALDKLLTANNPWPKRSLLPFLEDALWWLTGTTTTKNPVEIKWQINLLMQEQTKQQETLVHIIFILNITWYTTQVNRQKLNEVTEGKPRCKYTIQYHSHSNKVSQIPPNIHLCPHYIDLHQGLLHVHETSCHTHNRLYQCSYD